MVASGLRESGVPREKMLDDKSLKKGLKVLWFSTGSEDGLINTSRATVDVLKKHGVILPSAGGRPCQGVINDDALFAEGAIAIGSGPGLQGLVQS